MRTKAVLLETLSQLEAQEVITGFVHDGGLLGVSASDDVIVSIAQYSERRYTWRELDAFVDGYMATIRYLTATGQAGTLRP